MSGIPSRPPVRDRPHQEPVNPKPRVTSQLAVRGDSGPAADSRREPGLVRERGHGFGNSRSRSVSRGGVPPHRDPLPRQSLKADLVHRGQRLRHEAGIGLHETGRPSGSSSTSSTKHIRGWPQARRLAFRDRLLRPCHGSHVLSMLRTGCGSWMARLSRSATARSVPRAATTGSPRTCRSSSMPTHAWSWPPPARPRATRPTPMCGATPVCRTSAAASPRSATAPTSTPAWSSRTANDPAGPCWPARKPTTPSIAGSERVSSMRSAG